MHVMLYLDVMIATTATIATICDCNIWAANITTIVQNEINEL